MSHTAEPWEYVDCQCGSLSCQSGGIKGIADHQGAMHKDDARRIVACVNACEGIPTAALARLMAENERLNDILREWIAADDAYNEIDYPGSRRFDRLEAAKAEARAALKGEPK